MKNDLDLGPGQFYGPDQHLITQAGCTNIAVSSQGPWPLHKQDCYRKICKAVTGASEENQGLAILCYYGHSEKQVLKDMLLLITFYRM